MHLAIYVILMKSGCKSENAVCPVFLLSECLVAVLCFCLTHATEVKRSLLLEVATENVPTEDGELNTHSAKLLRIESKK